MYNFLCKFLYLQALFLITYYFQWQALIINPLKFILRPKFEAKDQSLGKVAKLFEAKAEKPYACKAVGQEIK